jgi:hypothetical protein
VRPYRPGQFVPADLANSILDCIGEMFYPHRTATAAEAQTLGAGSPLVSGRAFLSIETRVLDWSAKARTRCAFVPKRNLARNKRRIYGLGKRRSAG